MCHGWQQGEDPKRRQRVFNQKLNRTEVTKQNAAHREQGQLVTGTQTYNKDIHQRTHTK